MDRYVTLHACLGGAALLWVVRAWACDARAASARRRVNSAQCAAAAHAAGQRAAMAVVILECRRRLRDPLERLGRTLADAEEREAASAVADTLATISARLAAEVRGAPPMTLEAALGTARHAADMFGIHLVTPSIAANSPVSDGFVAGLVDLLRDVAQRPGPIEVVGVATWRGARVLEIASAGLLRDRLDAWLGRYEARWRDDRQVLLVALGQP